MNFKLLLFLNSFLVAAIVGLISLFYLNAWQEVLTLTSICFVVSLIIFNYFFEKYIYRRIHTMYKLIHNLKLGKDLREAIGERISDDPISDAEKEVQLWAKDKKNEIEQLKLQEKFRREFLSNISHEFKTPLFATQGYIETLQDGLIEENIELSKTFLAKASKNLDRLNYLISDLDEISKLEQGRIVLNIEKFDICELIHKTIIALEDKAKEHQISLEFKVKSGAVYFVKGDKNKIEQVLINLIDNSLKYGLKGGVTKIKLFPLFEQILVEVTDNGLGIEEKNLSRVFERFYRTDKSRSREAGGSGLGLAIVKHIIEAHEQTVNVRSTEGIGTTFGFTLQRIY